MNANGDTPPTRAKVVQGVKTWQKSTLIPVRACPDSALIRQLYTSLCKNKALSHECFLMILFLLCIFCNESFSWHEMFLFPDIVCEAVLFYQGSFVKLHD